MQLRRQYHPNRPNVGDVVSVETPSFGTVTEAEEDRRWTVFSVKEKRVGKKIVTRMVLEQIVDQSPAGTEKDREGALVGA